MATFDCDWCGKCCRSFGEFIRIERQAGMQDYYCRYAITGEVFPVHVIPDFAEEIDDEYTDPGPSGGPGRAGCVFLRKNPAGPGFACAVYATRPTVCREFRCYRMLIHDRPGGEVRGRVIGIGELRTGDEKLAAVWAEKIACLPHPFTTGHDAVQHVSAPGAAPAHGHESHIPAHLSGAGCGDDSEWVRRVVAVLAEHGYHGDPVE